MSVLLFAGVIFFTGIQWGLPSREFDKFLFGVKEPWTGRQIMDLAGAWDTSATRGADIAMHPIATRNQPVLLNDTDAKRAEIVRRYRLYSNQPDEMITFRSLSGMKPGKVEFDPKMYQYGGLWIYPIGGLLKLAGFFHLVTLRTDLQFYLDHPEAFASFYLLARSYSAAWGLIGVLVVFALAQEWTGKFAVGATSAMIFASMPVVIDLAHEAKPHLAGTVLTLLALLAAIRYVRTGTTRWWIAAGLFAGTAMGMVLTGYAAFAVLPMMTLLRPMSWKNRFKVTTMATLIGIAIFTLTNPYLPFNFIFHHSVLHSNVGNYGSFYQPALSISALVVAGRSLLEGMSIAPLVLGISGAAVLIRPKNVSLLFAGVAAPVLIQFVLLDAGKNAEYARFALTFDVILALFAAAFIHRLTISLREKNLAAAMLIAGTLYFGIRYDINFLLDNRLDSTRRTAAQSLQSTNLSPSDIAVLAEPAPYSLPPVDLFTRRILLQPPGTTLATLSPGLTLVHPVDYPSSIDPSAPPRAVSPISWANKPFEIVSTVSTATSRP